MLNGDASSHPFHSLPPPPPPPPHSHQTLFSSFGYHRLSPSSADEPRYGQGSSPLASCSPWIFPFFSFKSVCRVFSLCSASPPSPGGLQGVCVCMQSVHAACMCAVGTAGAIAPRAHPLQRHCHTLCPQHGPPSPPRCPHAPLWVPEHPQSTQGPVPGQGWLHGGTEHRDPLLAAASLQGPALSRSGQCSWSWKGLRHRGLSQGMFLGLAQHRQSPAEPWGSSPGHRQVMDAAELCVESTQEQEGCRGAVLHGWGQGSLHMPWL